MKDDATIEDQTPATLAVAVIFIALVIYFIIEHYFTASEYYAGNPPYTGIFLSGVAGALLVMLFLKRVEPERKNTPLFALLTGLGVGLASYSFIPRANMLTDTDGLREYSYTLATDHVWRSDNPVLPELRLYSKDSRWWRQYGPGDTYTFELRKGGLGIWQVNMSKVYEAQKMFYECDGVLSCMSRQE